MKLPAFGFVVYKHAIYTRRLSSVNRVHKSDTNEYLTKS